LFSQSDVDIFLIMLPLRASLIFSAIFVIFIGSFFLLRDFIILNEEISSTRAELLKEKFKFEKLGKYNFLLFVQTFVF
jgi:hypothetical protein